MGGKVSQILKDGAEFRSFTHDELPISKFVVYKREKNSDGIEDLNDVGHLYWCDPDERITSPEYSIKLADITVSTQPPPTRVLFGKSNKKFRFFTLIGRARWENRSKL